MSLWFGTSQCDADACRCKLDRAPHGCRSRVDTDENYRRPASLGPLSLTFSDNFAWRQAPECAIADAWSLIVAPRRRTPPCHHRQPPEEQEPDDRPE